MAWRDELRDMERDMERYNEPNVEQNHTSEMHRKEESKYLTYGNYMINLNTLEELNAIAEDVEEAKEMLENSWKKSECNPQNIEGKLSNPSFEITDEYYEAVKESLVQMKRDGKDIQDILKKLEECWQKSQDNAR